MILERLPRCALRRLKCLSVPPNLVHGTSLASPVSC
nr:MAG TPA: hypothetical protein [Caudoviricetes sp.]